MSLLPVLLKVIEKVVQEQTTKFLNDNNLLYNYQSGFRSNHSTDRFLSFLNENNFKGFDNGMYTALILIDLQKTFDTVNHKNELDKLLSISFSKNTISWYESFSKKSLYCISCNSGSKIRKHIMWCSARFNFRSSTVFDLCQ